MPIVNARRITLALLLALILSPGMDVSAEAQETWQMKERADQYGQMAVDMLRSGDVSKAAKLLNLALQTNPYDNRWRMHYISLMSKKGQASMQAGNAMEARVVFKVVEREFLKAAKLFKDRGDDYNLANCYAQIGDINRYVFKNLGLGMAYYQKALEYNPEHAAALKALGRA